MQKLWFNLKGHNNLHNKIKKFWLGIMLAISRHPSSDSLLSIAFTKEPNAMAILKRPICKAMFDASYSWDPNESYPSWGVSFLMSGDGWSPEDMGLTIL